MLSDCSIKKYIIELFFSRLWYYTIFYSNNICLFFCIILTRSHEKTVIFILINVVSYNYFVFIVDIYVTIVCICLFRRVAWTHSQLEMLLTLSCTNHWLTSHTHKCQKWKFIVWLQEFLKGGSRTEGKCKVKSSP